MYENSINKTVTDLNQLASLWSNIQQIKSEEKINAFDRLNALYKDRLMADDKNKRLIFGVQV